MFKMGENYVPELSEYIIGTVQDVNEDMATINVLAGFEETKDPIGKFSMDEDAEKDEENQQITLRIDGILSGKIIQFQMLGKVTDI